MVRLLDNNIFITLLQYLHSLNGLEDVPPTLHVERGFEQFSISDYPHHHDEKSINYFANKIMEITMYSRFDYRMSPVLKDACKVGEVVIITFYKK